MVEGDRIKIIDFGIAMKEDARRITLVGSRPHWVRPITFRPNR